MSSISFAENGPTSSWSRLLHPQGVGIEPPTIPPWNIAHYVFFFHLWTRGNWFDPESRDTSIRWDKFAIIARWLGMPLDGASCAKLFYRANEIIWARENPLGGAALNEEEKHLVYGAYKDCNKCLDPTTLKIDWEVVTGKIEKWVGVKKTPEFHGRLFYYASMAIWRKTLKMGEKDSQAECNQNDLAFSFEVYTRRDWRNSAGDIDWAQFATTVNSLECPGSADFFEKEISARVHKLVAKQLLAGVPSAHSSFSRSVEASGLDLLSALCASSAPVPETPFLVTIRNPGLVRSSSGRLERNAKS